MSEIANVDQAAAWDGPDGAYWVRHQARFDETIRPHHARLMAAAAIGAGERVLDIGCGNGMTSRDAVRAAGPTGEVLGVDLSGPMLGKAQELAKNEGLGNARFERGDAQVYRFEPGTFDVVLSRFGVMFFDDPVAAFANVRGALRPGGRLDAVCWAGPEHNPWFRLPLEVAEGRLGPAPPAPPEAPGPMAFRDTERVTGLLRRAGFDSATGTPRDVTLQVAGGLDAAMPLLTGVGPVARHLRDKDGSAEDLAAIVEVVRERLAPFAGSGPLRIPARIIHYAAKAHA